jgi:guanine deaminase
MARTRTPDHETFLRRAIELGARGALEFGAGGPFGAVVARNGSIIAEGFNRVVAARDPTWHAEMEAIRLAAAALGDFRLAGCTLYASCEPCPMCQAAAHWARLDAIYYASTGADARAFGGFDDTEVRARIALPPDRRTPPCRQLLRDEALKVWEAYQAKPDKVPY